MSAEDADARLVEMIAIRRANAASSEKLKQPIFITNNVPPQGARKDTALPQPSPKASPTMSSEDDVEF